MSREPIKLKVPSKQELESKPESEYNEIEKSISGLPYNAFVQELINGRVFAKLKCQEFNNSSPLNLEPRKIILSELLGTFHNDDYIEPPFWCDYGSNIHLGENVYMNHNCCLLDECEITIGKNTFLGPGVQIYTAGHPIDPIERRYTEFGKPITIGQDCWIGGNVVILPGITIGDGVTIGAGSIVTKNIESYAVAVGNPAKVIKKLERKEN